MAQLRIDGLAHGGAGVGRLDGQVVFVPRTAPGDLVDAALTPRGRFFDGRLLNLVHAGADRCAPVCVHVDACSGCQWQQVAASAQATAKRANFVEALVRVGGIPRESLPAVAFVPSPVPLRYRRRARFMVDPAGALGYAGRGGEAPVALRECHLLLPVLERLALALSKLLRSIVPRPHHVELCAVDARGAALLDLPAPMASTSLRALGERVLAEIDGLSGVVVRAGDRVVEVGVCELPDGETLLRPDVFAQANGPLNVQLVTAVVGALGLAHTDRVLELYAGHGNFTFSIARLAREVVAIEREGTSLALLRKAAAQSGLSNIQAVGGDAAPALARLVQQGWRFDRALLDPPRTGAAPEVLSALAASGPARIVYVSCDPATLARDLRALRPSGFELTAATVFDQFPQTFHMEAMAVLERV